MSALLIAVLAVTTFGLTHAIANDSHPDEKPEVSVEKKEESKTVKKVKKKAKKIKADEAAPAPISK